MTLGVKSTGVTKNFSCQSRVPVRNEALGMKDVVKGGVFSGIRYMYNKLYISLSLSTYICIYMEGIRAIYFTGSLLCFIATGKRALRCLGYAVEANWRVPSS